MIPLPSVTYNNIVSLDFQHELIHIRNQQVQEYFRIGDIALALVQGNQGVYEAREIQAAVGFYVGKSARSVRSYQAIAEKIPGDMREELAIYDLSFAHFAYAARFPGREVEVLNWVIDRNASVDATKNHFGHGQPLTDPTPPDRIEYTSTPQLFASLTLHLWRTADKLGMGVDKRARVKALLGELWELFSG
jgi:hypothetical protein